ncbi:MAG: phosphopantetheine-binding protein [Chthoniobacteraceae bacterium]
MTTIPTRDDVFAIVKKQLLEVMDEVSEDQIDPQRSLTEFGANSLDIVEVVSLSMRELRVKIPRAELALLDNLDELVDTLHAAAVKAAASPA